MSVSKLRGEVNFGLENLDKIYQSILSFVQQEIDEQIKTSALVYECLGYYNAIEHLIIRILKNLSEIPSGPFSHRDTLRTFEVLIRERQVDVDDEVLEIIENLMAFRHVATKIYGFLIDWSKLESIINEIEENHRRIKRLVLDVLAAL